MYRLMLMKMASDTETVRPQAQLKMHLAIEGADHTACGYPLDDSWIEYSRLIEDAEVTCSNCTSAAFVMGSRPATAFCSSSPVMMALDWSAYSGRN